MEQVSSFETLNVLYVLLLNNFFSTANSTDVGFFKMKGEKMWDDTETGILTSHGLGALNVADLVAAFNTIPLHVQLNIPEEALPVRSFLLYCSQGQWHD